MGSAEQQVHIAVTFLTGRYHGEEWPPSPARFYQALVAAVMTCGYRELFPIVEPALRWLETGSATRIRASRATPAARYDLFVPNNDMDVVGRDWLQGKPGDPSKLRTRKVVESRLLPERGPHVQYTWVHDTNPPPCAALQTAVRLLHTLGWGVDMAFADVGAEVSSGVNYQASASGETVLMEPIAGTLDDLRDAYLRFSMRTSGAGVDTHTRPSLLRGRSYSERGSYKRPSAAFRLLDEHGRKARAVPWRQAQTVSAWLRHEAGIQAKGELPKAMVAAFVQGHAPAGAERSSRISYLGLPSLTGPHPDGSIRRAVICEPPESDGSTVRLLERKMTGALLSGESGVRTLLAAPEEPDRAFQPYLTLNPLWRSVTPVILHGHNARDGRISLSKTERLILRALAIAGYAEEDITALAFQTAPLWRGCGNAQEIRVPKHLDGYPRLHVQVSFRAPVRGPVLAGLGQHYGVGLFAGL